MASRSPCPCWNPRPWARVIVRYPGTSLGVSAGRQGWMGFSARPRAASTRVLPLEPAVGWTPSHCDEQLSTRPRALHVPACRTSPIPSAATCQRRRRRRSARTGPCVSSSGPRTSTPSGPLVQRLTSLTGCVSLGVNYALRTLVSLSEKMPACSSTTRPSTSSGRPPPSVEMAPSRSSPTYWDPALRQDKRSLDEFIGLLRKAGLVTWRREAHSHVGCFFVPKKDRTLRLVLDRRPTNALHRRSPYSDLATPGALANFNLSDEWVQHCEDNSDYDPYGAAVGLEAFGRLDVHGAGVDLKDGFYQILTPTLSSWFSLGVTYRADEVGIDSVFNEKLRCFEPIAPGEEVWARFAGLPWGGAGPSSFATRRSKRPPVVRCVPAACRPRFSVTEPSSSASASRWHRGALRRQREHHRRDRPVDRGDLDCPTT